MRVLVVEDDAKIASFVVKGLKQEGYAVDHAPDGDTGLALAGSTAYDAAVIDVMLPGLDGLSLVKRIRAGSPTLPVLFLSARASVDDRVRGLQAGGDDYLTKPFAFAIGGKERQDSVWNGLEALPREATLVAIQDGARPCTSERIISDTLAAAREVGAAVAAQKVTDTIKELGAENLIARNVDRSRLWAVQTPQAFRVEVIRRALAEVKARGMSVTDDTAACELIGQAVRLVESATPNPKVTTAGDLPLIELLLRGEGR